MLRSVVSVLVVGLLAILAGAAARPEQAAAASAGEPSTADVLRAPYEWRIAQGQAADVLRAPYEWRTAQGQAADVLRAPYEWSTAQGQMADVLRAPYEWRAPLPRLGEAAVAAPN
jgi:hypothetical protein